MKKPTKPSVAPEHKGFDGAGHMDPAHAQRLLELGRAGKESDDTEAFPLAAEDDLAEELAETAVSAMTSGEDSLMDELEAEVEEESGGPFIETSGNVEFAGGTDESNIADATREPVPLANADDESGEPS
ncbi:MAG: hypothetical protein EOO73_35855 [Myxococcales bacterium]|nr:MAG: hypothetical protein EOO73_35855 [Myxococcales bacterium]